MNLRYYQKEAVNSIYHALRTRKDNPCVVIPTGGGKTPVIATICKEVVQVWRGRILVLSHVKELLEQTEEKLYQVDPELNVGVFSSGLKRRETKNSIILGGIQSVFNKAELLGHFDLIIVDEAHLIPPAGYGRYQTLIKDIKTKINPKVRIVGLTATPYRMGSGMICGENNILNHICYEIGVKELIERGFLCNLVTKLTTDLGIDYSKLRTRGDDFDKKQAEEFMDSDERVQAACDEIIKLTKDCKSVLIFAAGIRHTKHVADILSHRTNERVEYVIDKTSKGKRRNIIIDTKKGLVKFLVNNDILTTGFDAPNIDCVVLLRMTKSHGLYYQMIGRVFRPCEGKPYGLVLDYGGNIERLGPVDKLTGQPEDKKKEKGEAPKKHCEECGAEVHASLTYCPMCGATFTSAVSEPKHGIVASKESILSEEKIYTQEQITEIKEKISSEPVMKGVTFDNVLDVDYVEYSIHHKKPSAKNSIPVMRVDYYLMPYSMVLKVSEFVCLEHQGRPQYNAFLWWKLRSNFDVPKTIAKAVKLANQGALSKPSQIRIDSVLESFPEIVDHWLGPKPTSLNKAEGINAHDEVLVENT